MPALRPATDSTVAGEMPAWRVWDINDTLDGNLAASWVIGEVAGLSFNHVASLRDVKMVNGDVGEEQFFFFVSDVRLTMASEIGGWSGLKRIKELLQRT